MWVHPDVARGLARVLAATEVGGQPVKVYPYGLGADWQDHLPVVEITRTGGGYVDGPLATTELQLAVRADRFVVGSVADALVALLDGADYLETPEGLLDDVRVSGQPTVVPYHEDVSSAVFSVMVDTRGEHAA